VRLEIVPPRVALTVPLNETVLQCESVQAKHTGRRQLLHAEAGDRPRVKDATGFLSEKYRQGILFHDIYCNVSGADVFFTLGRYGVRSARNEADKETQDGYEAQKRWEMRKVRECNLSKPEELGAYVVPEFRPQHAAQKDLVLPAVVAFLDFLGSRRCPIHAATDALLEGGERPPVSARGAIVYQAKEGPRADQGCEAFTRFELGKTEL